MYNLYYKSNVQKTCFPVQRVFLSAGSFVLPTNFDLDNIFKISFCPTWNYEIFIDVWNYVFHPNSEQYEQSGDSKRIAQACVRCSWQDCYKCRQNQVYLYFYLYCVFVFVCYKSRQTQVILVFWRISAGSLLNSWYLGWSVKQDQNPTENVFSLIILFVLN